MLDNVMVCDGGESVSATANTTEIVGNVFLSIVFTRLWGIKGLAAASVVCKLIFLAIVLIWYIRHSHVRLILRDSGLLFDITEDDGELSSFRSYIISRTVTLSEYKSYLIATGHNRNEIYLSYQTDSLQI